MKFFAKIIKKYKDIKMELVGKDLKDFYDFQITKLSKKLEKNKSDRTVLNEEIKSIKEKKKSVKG
jgi:hypothetical protein